MNKARLPSALRRYVIHPIEALAAVGLYVFFRLLPLDVASAIGGFCARAIGPSLGLSRRAVRNLKLAFPEKTPGEIRAVVRAMWDNLGRVAAEFPHLSEIDVYAPGGRVEVTGTESIDLLRDDGKPGMFFSAHFGNWEILSLGATQRGLPLDRVYRAANNRLAEWLYRNGRAAVEGALIPKGPGGVRTLLGSIKSGKHLGMLVDQKMNDGIASPFFGRPAMTATALMDLARRFECPVVPARVVRTKGAHFRLIAEPPMALSMTDDHGADLVENVARMNAVIEGWVRENPEQWLWLHNRWSD